MKFIVTGLLVFSSINVLALDYQIVGEDVCNKRGRYWAYCAPPNETVFLEVRDPAIPMDMKVSYKMGKTCQSKYPLGIEISVGNNSSAENLSVSGEFLVDQSGKSSAVISTINPAYQRAYYPQSCEITATISPNIVNMVKLKSNIKFEKNELEEDIEIYDDRINDKLVLERVTASLDLLNAVVAAAETESASYSSLSEILETYYDPVAGEKNFSDQMRYIISFADIEFSEITISADGTVKIVPVKDMNAEEKSYELVDSIALKLDDIIKNKCNEGSQCANIHLDDATKAEINQLKEDIKERIGEVDNLESVRLISERDTLSSRLLVLKAIAAKYGVDWDSI